MPINLAAALRSSFEYGTSCCRAAHFVCRNIITVSLLSSVILCQAQTVDLQIAPLEREVGVGEPIGFSASLVNDTPDPLVSRDFEYRVLRLQILVSYEGGRLQTIKREVSPDYGVFIQKAVLEPFEKVTKTIYMNNLIAIDMPGNYVIVVRDLDTNQDTSMSFTVRPYSAQHQEERLSRLMNHAKQHSATGDEAEALLAVRHPAVVPYFRELSEDWRYTTRVIDALADIETVQSVNALASIAGRFSPAQLEHEQAVSRLRMMSSRTENAEVKWRSSDAVRALVGGTDGP